MIYLISGTSRSGKTMIAEQLSAQKGISYLSLDWLVMGFTNGIPEYGLHDMLFPDDIAERLWSFLKAMLENMLWSDIDYIIEGEAILPELIIELLEKHPNKLKICFVGYTDIPVEEKVKDIKTFSSGERDWLIEKTDDYIVDHVKNMIAHSIKIKTSCKKQDMRYFDTSKDFMGVVEEALDYLLV